MELAIATIFFLIVCLLAVEWWNGPFAVEWWFDLAGVFALDFA